jgi:hypothetical protein
MNGGLDARATTSSNVVMPLKSALLRATPLYQMPVAWVFSRAA